MFFNYYRFDDILLQLLFDVPYFSDYFTVKMNSHFGIIKLPAIIETSCMIKIILAKDSQEHWIV
jgi:hypothetical protein